MEPEDEMSIEQMLDIVTQLSVVSEDDRERLRKLLIERTGSANIPSLEDSNKQRLTYDPTDYEYYLFFVTAAFVIGVIGKNNVYWNV